MSLTNLRIRFGEGLAEALRLEGAASFNTKSLIFTILTGLLIGYIVGYLQHKDAYFDLKEQLENITTEFNRLQVELAETTAGYEALQQSYRELEEEYEDLEAKHLDFVKVYKLKYFTFSDLTITPTVIELGKNVTISSYITNVLQESSTFGITTNIKGPNYGEDIVDSMTVGGYETKKISYIEFPEVVGKFTVTIGGLTGFFVVTQASEG